MKSELQFTKIIDDAVQYYLENSIIDYKLKNLKEFLKVLDGKTFGEYKIETGIVQHSHYWYLYVVKLSETEHYKFREIVFKIKNNF